MNVQSPAFQILYPIFVAFVPLLLAYLWSKNKALLRRRRRADLNLMSAPDYCQRKQRAMFMQIGAAIYFMGCYFTLSAVPPNKNLAAVIVKIAMGAGISVAGLMAGRNDKAINDYGIKRLRDEYAKAEEAELRRRTE